MYFAKIMLHSAETTERSNRKESDGIKQKL